MQFKKAGKERFESEQGYVIEGNAHEGYEAHAPDGKLIVMWSIDIPHTKETCEEHFAKKRSSQ